ncbi:MAG: hypothetical protein AB8G26_04490, partial [Ilumatobacter sp.]
MRSKPSRSRRRLGAALAGAVLVAGACTSSDDDSADGETSPGDVTTEADVSSDSDDAGTEDDADAPDAAPVRRYVYPDPPTAPERTEANTAATDAIDRVVAGIQLGSLDADSVGVVRAEGDARHAWFISDLLRFFQGPDSERLVATFEDLTGVSVQDDPDLQRSPWLSITNHLIAWDTPDYEGYSDDKGAIFTQVEEAWEPFFADADAAIDWRYVSWGGVFIDDRPLGDPNLCPGGCIPALDDPA